MTSVRRSGGFALLLVIIVSLALMAIAIPFAISMRHQEKGAQGTSDRAQARYSAVAGRNHALAAVLRGHETIEEGPKARAPFNTPLMDTPDEFRVTWGAVRPSDSATGTLRGGLIQDEQAKLNTRTAPVTAVDNLKARVDGRTTDLRNYLTAYSGRPAAWVAPQTIRAIIPSSGGTAAAPTVSVIVDDPDKFSEGTRVRVTSNGAPGYGTVTEVNPNGNDITISGIPESATDVGAVIEIECRHPININTAPAVVIAACLEGLGLRNKLTEDTVSGTEADNLAAAMVKQPFPDLDEFWKFLALQREGGVISDNDVVAIIINFTNPSARRLAGTGTVPFILHSWCYYTVEARGVQDLPSGAIAAECDLREIVELAPSGTLRWRVQSQYDFERMLKLPVGRNVLTWPACVANREVPSTDRNADAWVTTQTGRDERANWPIRNHWDNTLQGLKMEGKPYVQAAGSILSIPGGAVDIEAGAAEMWVKTPSTTFTVFDTGTEDWSNRIWLWYGYDSVQGGNCLRLVVKDASLEHSYAEVVHLVTLLPNTWYHIGAYWKGTKFGHAMIMLDGLPVGRYGVWTETGQARHVTLQSALVPTDTTVMAQGSVSGFPPTGAIEIGNEAIEYTGISGSSFTGCVRGARGTNAQDHQAGAGITVWGYKSLLVRGTLTFSIPNVPAMVWDRLTTGGGTLVGPIGADTDSNVGSTPTPNPRPPGLPPVMFPQAAQMLTIPAADLPNFPPRGWLTVGMEVIHYDSRNATQLTGITRGLFGTTDTDHLEFEPVRLFGFHVSDNTNYLNPTVLSIDSEWFGPVVKEGTDGWRGTVASIGGIALPIPLRRGPNNLFLTGAAAHNNGALVLPTFALADQSAGDGDVVTFVEQNMATREEHTVMHVRWVPNLPMASASPPFLLASLEANVRKEWVPDNLWVRILKFPSGELMGTPQTQMTFGGSAMPASGAPLTGFIDEVRMTTGPKNLGFMMSAAIDATATTIPMFSVSGMDGEGGAILVGNELIGYAGTDPAANTLINCTRGYLGTAAVVHEPGDRIFNMAFLAIASLTAGVGAADRTIPCVPNGFPWEGYALVGTELFGYTYQSGTGLVMPDACDFRGAFGTTAAAHNTYDLVYAFPFRYFDRFSVNCDDTWLTWFGACFRATGAKWQRLVFEQRLPNSSVAIRVLVRFNSEPRWTTPPNNKPMFNGKGGVWLFTGNTGGSLIGAHGDQIDVKVEFVWNDGAYSKGEWKESPEFHGLTVDYEQEPVVHLHEER